MVSDHIAKGVDFQVRLRWKLNSVVLWDSKSEDVSLY